MRWRKPKSAATLRCGAGLANLSASTLIPSRTGTRGRPRVLMAGPLRWAVDSVGGTKPANPSGSGFLRGALPDRVLFPCWCGRSGGAPASASALMTVTDGPQARLTIERHSALGSAGQHVSVDVSGLGILSLPLRPLYPNLLVTGVLVYACLGTCVFRLTSLLDPPIAAKPTVEEERRGGFTAVDCRGGGLITSFLLCEGAGRATQTFL